tara:strand:+ start:103 stop:696 length:594 start_codon:yes stop_codon:yes gene_type:complete
MKKSMILLFTFFLTIASAVANEPTIGGPCQGCELVFVGLPKQLKSHARIAPYKVEGEPLILNGTAYKIDGKPAAGVIIYAYQTNNEGIYPKGKTFHGGFRGWVLTDKHGKYSFETIRPQAYPNRSIPEHIHLHVIEPQKGTYYIDSVEFSDDPLMTNEFIESRPCRAGCGVTNPTKNKKGTWYVRRDIFLGRSIPDY